MKNFIKSAAVIAGMAMAVTAGARENVGGKGAPGNVGSGGGSQQLLSSLKGTASTCIPALAKIDLDINNVRARLMTGGDMWWDPGLDEARYEVPKGSHKSSLFAGSLWVGGYDANKQLKVAAQTYRQNGNDYWPGPLDNANAISKAECSDWDQFWKVNKSDITAFRSLIGGGAGNVSGPQYDAIKAWPAAGNQDAVGVSGAALNALQNAGQANRTYAPFVDLNGNGIYEWQQGDYPDVLGDQYIWWVFNDAGAQKLETGSESIGLEVQASAFAFGTKDFLNDATFYNYRLINRGSQALDSTFVATWTDADLGYFKDDYIGCDTSRSLGILYNGKSVDGNGEPNSYGSQVPMVGVDFFIGPRRYNTATGKYDTLGMAVFNYYNNTQSGALRNPQGIRDYYNYMSGTNAANQHIRYDFQGAGTPSTGFGAGPLVNAVFTGDPSVNSQWSECASGNVADDRRFIHSAGPFRLEGGGVTNNITIGVVWVADAGGCPKSSFSQIRSADDQAQALFDNGFKTIEGPEAPTLTVREMDRKLIFYLTNDSLSTNFQEQYGDPNAPARFHVSKPKMRHSPDSLYKFEGYRVFQLKDASVNPSQIFDNTTGAINQNVASEVFETDVKNGINRANNFYRYTDVISNVQYNAQTNVKDSKDSGIQHSFVLTNDAFATGADKKFVNYRNYYFVAIAYAYNNFRPFNPNNFDSTQDIEYLESAHGGGGVPIRVVAAMPNPANGSLGTALNSDYGDGVELKRIEGTGNGHNSLQIKPESEAEALTSPDFQSKFPVYMQGQGPAMVKVVDPRNVKARNWELYIYGTPNDPFDSTKGLNGSKTSWKLVSDQNDLIYSSQNIGTLNEQILLDYGLSVSIKQVVRPGEDQVNGNGYIGSSVSFNDPTQPWLAGVNDKEQKDIQNWIRSGKSTDTSSFCNFNDVLLDTTQAYESLLSNSTPLKASWAPYALAVNQPTANNRQNCENGVSANPGGSVPLRGLQSVDVVFTSDKSKWTKCAVVEIEDVPDLAEHNVSKFFLRGHASWTGNTQNGQPVYSNVKNDTGMSYFPGYAINQETGERLNIVFSEDSWLKSQNGADMLWNPTSTLLDDAGNVIFGGKQYVYILGTKYDEDVDFRADDELGSDPRTAFYKAMWVGLPLLNGGSHLKSLEDGLIPTETRIRLRVDRPYAQYIPDAAVPLKNGGFPLYSFSTQNLAPVAIDGDGNHTDKQALLDGIQAVPNPYYGYSGYELNRLDTKVRIINLPTRATIDIYSLDGTLVRRVEKSDPNLAYIDWDIRNAKGLPVGSGMYLMHVNAVGIGETIIRWFGSLRPIDITNF